MKWSEIRKRYPKQWLLLEALEAHSENGHRIMDKIAVLNTFLDSNAAFQEYRQLHREKPEREMFVAHTDKEILNIRERFWAGVRG
jgi:hypothetical protein